MSSFLTSLWESIFTPGPTPTLLIATNASFACLQVVLLALLLATYSVHFVVLSFLCAGLWWSINWFVVELQASNVQEARVHAEGHNAESEREDMARPEGKGSAAGDDEDTETEGATPAPEKRKIQSATAVTTTARLRPEDLDATKKRRSGGGLSESEGSVSTDSEWEKVDQ